MTVECPLLAQIPGLKHAFFEAQPNKPATDMPQEMIALEEHLLPLVTLKQVHGNKVIHITKPLSEAVEGDGLVTRAKGISLGILTADCGPILFCDPVASVIGACHAGWRGAIGGIIQATLTAMEEEGATRSRIYATLGPTIQQMNYEVGPEFPTLIDKPYDTYFLPSCKEGHHYFNLPLYIRHQLLDAAIAHVHDLEQNTFIGNFSSRRRLLSQGIDKINFCNLSVIAII